MFHRSYCPSYCGDASYCTRHDKGSGQITHIVGDKVLLTAEEEHLDLYEKPLKISGARCSSHHWAEPDVSHY